MTTTPYQRSDATALPRPRLLRRATSARSLHVPQPTPRLLVPLALAGAAAALAAALLGAGSSVFADPLPNAAVRAVAIASWVGIGLQTWRLRPASGLGLLLVVGGFAFAATTPMALTSPAAFTLGRLAWVPFAVVLVYVMLAFPHGRVERRSTELAFRGAVAAIALMWIVLLLGGRDLPLGGILTRCDGTCPANPYGVFGLGESFAATLADVAALATNALILTVAVLLARRALAERGLQRAALEIPYACLFVFAASVALSGALRVSGGDDPLALAVGWLSVVSGLLVPWALLAGQVRGRLIESTLLERRNIALEGELQATARELRASRARIFAAGAQERRRIERDLHDSGQNRLVALRIKLGLAADEARAAGAPELRDELVALGEEAQDALDAVRAIAHGIYPSLLATRGLAAALEAEAQESLLPVQVHCGTAVCRSSPDVEAAVWYCCLEAIQNACKHAGAGARVAVRLECVAGRIDFVVADDGGGVTPEQLAAGSGLTHMRDRVFAVGGSLEVTSAPSTGTLVHGSAPWPARPGRYQGDLA
ncbi:histidine kinase [Conexibacter sp. CPCC 206217]|uniref:sensor histidine kinase n=1 Tax=Conexibacter sp. CPCC 206217 TaxID=3064574 RepID=UPI002723D9BE|nr:histidine kinase [Conexibacter sp. CPCC 206217]MDO8209505.1 histidine kinase [Conexibacter sp. CPCC 206217]